MPPRALNALVVPYDSGFRGARMGAGPERLLAAGLLDGVRDAGTRVSTATFEGTPAIRGEIGSAVDIQHWLSSEVTASLREGAFPLVLAGNCMSAVGITAGVRGFSGRPVAVCWFDAHADYNTPDTTPSGFFDGMALATLTGHCWSQLMERVPGFQRVTESQVLLFGARDLDTAERAALERTPIGWIKPYSDIAATSERLRALRKRAEDLYLHIDLDVLDAADGRANSYASTGGLTRHRLLDLVREIVALFNVRAAALTAYDPGADREGKIPGIAADIVREIVAS